MPPFRANRSRIARSSASPTNSYPGIACPPGPRMRRSPVRLRSRRGVPAGGTRMADRQALDDSRLLGRSQPGTGRTLPESLARRTLGSTITRTVKAWSGESKRLSSGRTTRPVRGRSRRPSWLQVSVSRWQKPSLKPDTRHRDPRFDEAHGTLVGCRIDRGSTESGKRVPGIRKPFPAAYIHEWNRERAGMALPDIVALLSGRQRADGHCNHETKLPADQITVPRASAEPA